MHDAHEKNKMNVKFKDNDSKLSPKFVAELEALLLVVLNLDIEGECTANIYAETLCIKITQGGEQKRNFCMQVADSSSGTRKELPLEQVSADLMRKLRKQFIASNIGEAVAAV